MLDNNWQSNDFLKLLVRTQDHGGIRVQLSSPIRKVVYKKKKTLSSSSWIKQGYISQK